MIGTTAELAGQLKALPPDLAVYITDGDLPPIPVAAVSARAADYGQLALITGDAAGVPGTVAWLAGQLGALPQDLAPYLTNGDLPPAPVTSVSVQPADFGDCVLISR